MTALITTFAFLSYFAMATGDGIATLHSSYTEHHDIVPPTTQDIYTEVYWARYVDWTLTTPLLLIDLSLLAGLNGASMTIAVIADVIMILTGLFAGFGRTGGQKWGWYTIACIAFLVIPYQVLGNGRKFAAQKDAKTKKFFFAIAVYTMILWTVYPMYVSLPSIVYEQTKTDCFKVFGALLTAPAPSLSMARSSPTLFSTFSPNPSSVSGFCLRTMLHPPPR